MQFLGIMLIVSDGWDSVGFIIFFLCLHFALGVRYSINCGVVLYLVQFV